MDFWTKEKILEALGNCKFYNFPENWSAKGIRIWHEPLGENDIICVRSPGETKGATKQNIMPILSKISAVMCTHYENFRDLNIPIIEIEDITKSLYALGRYIRKFYKGKVITLTGSAGKSTTTKMLYDVLEEYGADANLNLANTLIALCWNMTTFDLDKKYWVIESSIGHGYITVPDIAIITNLAAVHLKEGQTIEEMARGKSKIFATMKPGSIAILNREMECYEIFEQAAKEKQLKILTTGERENVDVRIFYDLNHSAIKGGGHVYDFSGSFIPRHLIYDMASVVAVAMVLDLPPEKVVKKLENFKCLKGRGEILNLNCNGKNITLIDEAFNANPLSMAATIESFGKMFKENKILVLGDMTEGGDKSKEYHLSLVNVIKNVQPKKVILCGNDMKAVYDILHENFDCCHFESIDNLLPEIINLIDNNDNVFVKSSHSTGLYKLVDKLKKCN